MRRDNNKSKCITLFIWHFWDELFLPISRCPVIISSQDSKALNTQQAHSLDGGPQSYKQQQQQLVFEWNQFREWRDN